MDKYFQSILTGIKKLQEMEQKNPRLFELTSLVQNIDKEVWNAIETIEETLELESKEEEAKSNEL